MLHVGDPDTMAGFSEALRGMSPEEEKEFEVTYPEDYGQEKLAGKTVRFRMKLKTIRTKELPELNDEFAQDLGDYPTLNDLREAIRKAIFHEREYAAQQKAKDELIDGLIETHEFPVPEAYIERQIEAQLENQFRELAERGIDPTKLKIDWSKLQRSAASESAPRGEGVAAGRQDRRARSHRTPPTTRWIAKCSASPSSSASQWPRCAKSCRRTASLAGSRIRSAATRR